MLQEIYSPAAYSHRNPVLFVLVGNGLLEKGYLPAAETMRTLLRNRGRLVGMHDIFKTLARLVGAPADIAKPTAFDILRQEIPADRTCAHANVSRYCNCFGDDARGLFPTMRADAE